MENRLRIGMLCPYSLTVPGGVQGQVMGLARALRRMGHEVRVLGPCDGAPPDTFVTPLGESLPTAANGSIAPLAPDPAAALRTIRVLTDEQFDVLHVHEPLSPGPTVTTLVMRTAPIVATFHAAGESTSYKYLNAALRRIAAGIDRRVAVSKDARLLAERYLGGDYEILPNGVELERFTGEPVERAPGSRRHIFFCGRHEPRKGLEILLRAHQTLPADVHVWVASNGPDTERLRLEYAGDPRIEWLGRISDEQKIDYLRRADVFCAPSLGGESFGVVLIEAMAACTPIVASALEGYMNVATDGVNALLPEAGDVDQLAHALRRVLDDPSLAARLVEAGRAHSEEFSMDSLARAYIDVYRDVIARRDVEKSTPSRMRRLLTRLLRMLGTRRPMP